MSSQINILQNRINEQDEHFAELERQLTVLETRLRQNVADLTAIIADGAEINAEVMCILRHRVDEQAKHIEKLEQRAAEAAEDIGRLAVFTSGIGNLRNTISLQADRIEKLEVALRDVVRCLIDGKVDMAALMPGELHRHRILGSESVQAMVEVYYRLKAQMGDPGYDTP